MPKKIWQARAFHLLIWFRRGSQNHKNWIFYDLSSKGQNDWYIFLHQYIFETTVSSTLSTGRRDPLVFLWTIFRVTFDGKLSGKKSVEKSRRQKQTRNWEIVCQSELVGWLYNGRLAHIVWFHRFYSHLIF